MTVDRVPRWGTTPLGALCSALLLLACSEDRPPNIVLISVDTLRADHTSVYGYERDTTPELSAFAREATTFDVAYAPTSTTAPSHATLFTALPPVAHGVLKNGIVLDSGFQTLAEIFSKAGFQTAGFVSSAVLSPASGLAKGFAVYDADFDEESVKTPKAIREATGINGSFDRTAAATTDLAIRWLSDERRGESPFLLFVHYIDPHSPYVPPAPFDERFASDSTDLLQATIDRYDGEVAYVDHHLGRLLQAVDTVDREAITLVTADHGEGLSDHGAMGHGVHIYEAFVRVPLLVRWRGRVSGDQRIPGPVHLGDVLPTLLDLAEIIPNEEPPTGRSLRSALLEGEPLDPDHPVHLLRRHHNRGRVDGTQVNGVKYGLRKGRFKYLEAPDERSTELYDLESDALERNDLSPFAGKVVAEMRGELRAWLKTHQRDQPAPSLTEEERRGLEALGYVD